MNSNEAAGGRNDSMVLLGIRSSLFPISGSSRPESLSALGRITIWTNHEENKSTKQFLVKIPDICSYNAENIEGTWNYPSNLLARSGRRLPSGELCALGQSYYGRLILLRPNIRKSRLGPANGPTQHQGSSENIGPGYVLD